MAASTGQAGPESSWNMVTAEQRGKHKFQLAWQEEMAAVRCLINLMEALPKDQKYGQKRRDFRRILTDYVERELWACEPLSIEANLSDVSYQQKSRGWKRLQQLVSFVVRESTNGTDGQDGQDGQDGEDPQLLRARLCGSLGQALGLKSWVDDSITSTPLFSSEELETVLQRHLPHLAPELAAYRRHQTQALAYVCEALTIFLQLQRSCGAEMHAIHSSFVRHGADWGGRIVMVRIGPMSSDMSVYKNQLAGLVSKDAKSRIMNHLWFLLSAKKYKFSEAAKAEKKKREDKKLENQACQNLTDGCSCNRGDSGSSSSWAKATERKSRHQSKHWRGYGETEWNNSHYWHSDWWY